jgi:hypothetical protein
MSIVTINLPGLDPYAAKDLVNMALAEWRAIRKQQGYVDRRYAHMDDEFRERRLERLAIELRALSSATIDAS